MKMDKYFAVFLIMIVISILDSGLAGQEISGKVTDEKGYPMSGAAVVIKDSFLGTYTNSGGSFYLKLAREGKYNLEFSFLGHKSVKQEVIVKNKISVNITLIPEEIMTGEVIVNSTRAGNKTPVTFTNVGRELIEKGNSGQDMPFLISLTPSLVETSETGTGIGYTGLRIRGTDGTRINVTLDGIPLNDAESQQVFWVDLPDLASSVDNIQVQRGVGTSSNGSGAFGASINIETKSPDNKPFAEISSAFGSFKTFKNTLSTGTGLLSDKFVFQMRLSEIKSDGYIQRTKVNNRSAYISGVYVSGKSRLRANLILGEEHTGISWWGVPKEMLSINRRYNPAGEFTDQAGNVLHYNNESDNYKQNHFQLIYSWNINRNLFLSTALHYTFGQGYYEEYRAKQALSDYGLSSYYSDDILITSTDLIRQKWMSNDFPGMVFSFSYNKGKIEAKIGGGINTYQGDNFGRIIWMRNAGDTEKDKQWYLNKSEKNEANIYGKINYKLSDRLNLFGDLNYRYIYYRIKGPDDDLRILSEDHHFNFFNPKAGIFFTISSNQDAFLSFAIGNKEPTRSDYKEASGDNQATPKPETLFDAEAGYNMRSNVAGVGINYFLMYYKDQLVPTGQLSNVGYPIMTNVEKSYRTGLEISAGIKPLRLINWDFNLTVSANKIMGFTEYYTDHITMDNTYLYKNKKLGEVDLAYSPSIISSSDITLNFSEKLKMHFITKFVGSQYFDNTMNRERMLSPYLFNNVRLDYSLPITKIRSTDVQLYINNILNNMYENNAYGGNWYEDGTENSWSYYFPQAGINFLLKISLLF
jgi:iron complex outermembrane receptor protein